MDYLPTRFQDSLYKFQADGIKFGIINFGRLLLADEMGVGKSIQGLGIALYYKSEWPLLIIVPATLVSDNDVLIMLI